MLLFKNVFTEPALNGGFYYLISTSCGKLREGGFNTAEEAAWAADKAKFLLTPFIKRHTGFNFPDRIDAMSEHEASMHSTAALEFVQMHKGGLVPRAATVAPTCAPIDNTPKCIALDTMIDTLQAMLNVYKAQRIPKCTRTINLFSSLVSTLAGESALLRGASEIPIDNSTTPHTS